MHGRCGWPLEAFRLLLSLVCGPFFCVWALLLLSLALTLVLMILALPVVGMVSLAGFSLPGK